MDALNALPATTLKNKINPVLDFGTETMYSFPVQINRCLRCERDWAYRGEGRALRCGKCGSPYWDRERLNGGNVEVVQTLRPADEAKGRQEAAGHVGSRERVPVGPKACPSCQGLNGMHAKGCKR